MRTEVIRTDLKDIVSMKNKEGLVIQCIDRNDLKDILDFFVEEEIITYKDAFSKAYLFNDHGIKKALLRFDHIKESDMCEIGRLAVWRLMTYPLLGGTWLSDFIDFNQAQQKEEWEQEYLEEENWNFGGY